MQDYLVSLDPITLIIMVVLLVIFLPVLLWLGITVLWIAVGLFAGTFVYFFLLYLLHIPLLAIAGGVGTAIVIWGALLRR
ncbi:MAG: hypothetical protein CVT73_01720 [Alphaproteobacteria bacterium HGW-Alphaproteobacteria-12]|nr:MAG: hypothetical protein CVT73_01720 [Alphaproteobacteria bacterium HGW-Alphaproteobacteria-12]